MPPRRNPKTTKTDSVIEVVAPTPCTYLALIKWSCKLFQKLGWMLLAKQRGHSATKILAYKESIAHIDACLVFKIKNMSNVDRKEDLEITLANIRILASSANTIL